MFEYILVLSICNLVQANMFLNEQIGNAVINKTSYQQGHFVVTWVFRLSVAQCQAHGKCRLVSYDG